MSDTTGMLKETMIDPVTGEIIDQKELAEQLLAQAKEQGVSLVGPGCLLSQLTKSVLEAAAKDRFEEFADQWGQHYPAIVQRLVKLAR